MRLDRRLAASLIAISVAGEVLAQEETSDSPPRAALASNLTDDVIKHAVKETLAAEPRPKHGQLDGRVLRGDSYEKFSRKFSDAQIPNCLRPDALKHQPTSVEYKGWVFGVGGLPALPFWLYAAASGKCRIATD